MCACLGFHVVLMVKNTASSAGDIETWVQYLGQEDPLKGMATHSRQVFLPRDSYGQSVCWALVHRVTKSWTQLKQLHAGRSLKQLK